MGSAQTGPSRTGWGPRYFAAALALVAAVAAGAGIALFNDRPELRFSLALAVLLTTTVAVIVYSFRRGDGLSILSLSAFFYLLAFGVGGVYFLWLADDFPTSPADLVRIDLWRDPYLFDAVVMSSVAWVMFCAGYLLMRPPEKLRLSRVLPSLPPLPVLVIGLLAVGWISRAVLISTGRYFHIVVSGEIVSTGTSWFVYALSTAPLLATALVGASVWRADPARQPVLKRLFWAMFAIELAWAIPTAERGQVVGIILLAGVVQYYGWGRRMRVASVVVPILVLVFLVFPVVLDYRSQKGYQDDPWTALSTAVDHKVRPDPEFVMQQGVTATFSRFSTITSLAAIRSAGREVYSRKPGETPLWAAEGFVPRLLVPEKADPGAFGNEFGRTYGIIATNDYTTAVSPTQVGEAYLNFGWLGLLTLMPLLGAFYRVLNDLLADRRGHPLTLALYAVLAWPVISSQETILATGLTGIAKILVVFVAIVAVLSFGHRLLGVSRGRGTRARAAQVA